MRFTTQDNTLPCSAEKTDKNRPLEKRIVKRLDAYFAGKLEKFDLPIKLDGTGFEKKVWRALLAIPYGQVSTYGKIATKIGRPKACRAVGGAIGKNCLAIIVPCHRVIKGDGSLGGYAWGPKVKQRLILLEKK